MRIRARAWRVVLAAAAALAAGSPAHAGSFMQSAGDVNYSTSLGHIWATEEWNSDRELEDAGCRREYSFNSHFLEYGRSYYHTLYGGVNLAQARCDADRKRGFGDVRLGVRGRLDVTRNYRTWELEATIPTHRDRTASLRLGCGALGLAGRVAVKEKLVPLLSAGASAGVQVWEAPLAHQAESELSLSGPFGQGSRWSWDLELNGRMPLDDSGADVNTDISDCGTRGKLVRGSLRLGFAVTDFVYAQCGYLNALWGEDVSRSQGAYCGFSRLWK